MRPEEKLHDALNYLDDDIIEEADKHRNRANSKRLWFKIIPAAACFCLILSGILIANNRGLFDNDSLITQNESTPTEITEAENVTQGTHFEDRENLILEPEAGQNAENTEEEFLPESESIPEAHSVTVRIDEWYEGEGFIATVTELIDTDIYETGTQFAVMIDDETVILIREGNEVYYEYYFPTEEDFSVGSEVRIQFRSFEVYEETPILYAETIEKIE